MSETEPGPLIADLVLQARNLMAEPGSSQRAESKFRAVCLQVLSIQHGLGPEETLRWAERMWAEVHNRGPVTKKRRKRVTQKRIPDEEQSDYKAGNVWVFDDSLELDLARKVSIEGSLIVSERVVPFGTDAHDDALAVERKIGKDGHRYFLVRRATIDEEAILLGRPWPSGRRSARMAKYPSAGIPAGITRGKLRRLSRALQTETMNAWFEASYKNPAVSMPRDDGEYVFVRGGPYRALDILWNEFQEVVPEPIIRDLADELEVESGEWVPISWPDAEGDIQAQPGISGADTRSPDERRNDLLKSIQELKAELQRIEPPYGGNWHNNPPEDSRLVPLSQADRSQVLESLEKLEEQAKAATPDEAQVQDSTSILGSAAAKTWSIAKRKVDKATDKIAENVGLALIASGAASPAYHWVQGAASSLYHKIVAVIHAADLWLSSIHLHPPF